VVRHQKCVVKPEKWFDRGGERRAAWSRVRNQRHATDENDYFGKHRRHQILARDSKRRRERRMRVNDGRGGYQANGDKRLIVPLVRQARELGADVIKADPTDQVEDYHEVIEAARCPVLVRGGGKADLQEVFRRSHAFLQQGAAGLVYGRNVYQHPAPARIVKALMAMIHDGAGPEAAWALYQALD
jgi:hypothetical protein